MSHVLYVENILLFLRRVFVKDDFRTLSSLLLKRRSIVFSHVPVTFLHVSANRSYSIAEVTRDVVTRVSARPCNATGRDLAIHDECTTNSSSLENRCADLSVE